MSLFVSSNLKMGQTRTFYHDIVTIRSSTMDFNDDNDIVQGYHVEIGLYRGNPLSAIALSTSW